jgi:hypothetical protein
MRRSLILLLLLSAVPMLPAQQKPASATIQLPPKPLLPQSFAGWTAVSAPVEATHPVASTISEESAAFRQELGFRRESIASYVKAGAKIGIDVIQFADATSAYAFFPYPVVGAGSFRNGDTVVLVINESGKPAHLKEDLQALSSTLPVATGSKAQLPSLPSYLPQAGLDRSSIVYAFGPEVWQLHALETKNPLAGKLDFNTGAEVIVAKYTSGGTLTLVEYPTPQMAQVQLKTFGATFNLAPQKELPNGLQAGTATITSRSGLATEPILAWRTGPIVALTDNIPQAEAIKLAHAVHYEAEITLNKPQGYVSEAWRAAHLYLGIAALAGILCAASVILGLFFGGARAIIRVLRGKSASAVEDTEFISLNLAHGPVHPDGRQD